MEIVLLVIQLCHYWLKRYLKCMLFILLAIHITSLHMLTVMFKLVSYCQRTVVMICVSSIYSPQDEYDVLHTTGQDSLDALDPLGWVAMEEMPPLFSSLLGHQTTCTVESSRCFSWWAMSDLAVVSPSATQLPQPPDSFLIANYTFLSSLLVSCQIQDPHGCWRWLSFHSPRLLMNTLSHLTLAFLLILVLPVIVHLLLLFLLVPVLASLLHFVLLLLFTSLWCCVCVFSVFMRKGWEEEPRTFSTVLWYISRRFVRECKIA